MAIEAPSSWHSGSIRDYREIREDPAYSVCYSRLWISYIMVTNITDSLGEGGDADPSVEDHEVAVVKFAVRGEVVSSNAPPQDTYS